MDFAAISSRFLVWGKDAAAIFAAAARIKAAYLKLEPTARQSLIADEQALVAQWTALDDALDAYNKADDLSKVGAIIQIGNTIALAAPIVTRIATDGESVFAADWAVLKPDVDLILQTLEGTSP